MCRKGSASTEKGGADSASSPPSSSAPKTPRPPCPHSDATLFQRLLFLWAWPLLKLGSSRPLEESDLPDVAVADSSAHNKSYVRERVWSAGDRGGRSGGAAGGLGRALLGDYFRTTRAAQAGLALNSAAKIAQAIALGLLMEQFTAEADGGGSAAEGYKWCAVLVACGLVTFLTKQNVFFELYRKGMRIRVGLVATLYDKSLRLSSTSNSSSIGAGKLTNIASNDVERFLMATIPSLYLILGPIEAVVILLIGIQTLGPVFAVGHAMFIILIPLQFYLGRRFVKFRRQVASISDARATLVSQAVSGVRIMKMNAWELEFQKRIAAIRTKEVATLKAASRFKALNEAIYYCSSTVVAAVIFAVSVGLGNELTPRNVYTTLTLLNILHLSLTKHIPNAVMQLSECHVSSQRIQEFLELPETSCVTTKDDNVNDAETSCVTMKDDNVNDAPQTLIAFENVSFTWDEAPLNDAKDKKIEAEASNVALSNISLSVEAGKLYGIIGKVGSGKSALIQAFAGELNVIGGSVGRSYTSLSYACQSPWIMNGSILENIVMGLPFRQEWYDQVIDACGLRIDLSIFIQGDKTVVGDRGVQCSGGQKARIGLARAFYRDPQVLILDDPLSAVDSTVARNIWYNAIQELGIKRGKCVIIATHQHQFMGPGNHCIVLEKGRIRSASLVEPSTADVSPEVTQVERQEDSGKKDKCSDAGQKEARSTGIIEWSTWSAYGASAGNFLTLAVFFFVYTVTQISLLLLIAAFGIWAEAPSPKNPSWFGIILGLAAFLLILSILRAQMTYQLLIGASDKLHNRMLEAVLRSKIDFFDTNPLGRILNRFSADVGICDETLPLTIYDFLVGVFIVCGGVITASVVLPFVLIALPLLILCFIRLRRIFVQTTRELKRLEGMSRSPIFAMMSESLHGVSTIRANSCVDYFRTKFENVHDAHTRAYFAFVASSRWFATRMDILSFILMSVASILAVFVNDQNWFQVDPAVVGLTLTLLIQIAGTNFPWIVRQSAEIVNQMTSVERILEFGALESEAPLKLDDDKRLASWPKNGSIVVNNLSVRYRPNLPLALEGASFSIPAGARIGVVGRTGSGKSTLVQAFFRLLEAKQGTITIDGINIADVGLHALRGKISVIPQTPTLFSGCTLRDNLDIFRHHSEEDIQRTLEEVHMYKTIMDLPLGINTIISEGGTNFSVGERQLLCLARANLNKCKILILDEATASVDQNTDHLLHNSLNTAYEDATIVKIAHRLDSVIEDDYILVLGSGKVVEIGPPDELMEAEGAFYKMVQDTNMSRELAARANAKNLKKET